MIIDDNHISVDGICHNIDWSDLNAEVACKAYDGQQALDYLQNNMVDLIISDIEMPQLDGLSIAQNALKINSSIKIILISAFDKFEYAKQAIRLGAFDYIEKPLDYAYLEELLNTDFRTMYYNLTQENRRAFWHSIIREIHLNTDHTVDSVDFL